MKSHKIHKFITTTVPFFFFFLICIMYIRFLNTAQLEILYISVLKNYFVKYFVLIFNTELC